MGMAMGGDGNRGDGKNGNGMIRWEWEGNRNKKVIPAHLYTLPLAWHGRTWRRRAARSRGQGGDAVPEIK